jgi:hypothetical protein
MMPTTPDANGDSFPTHVDRHDDFCGRLRNFFADYYGVPPTDQASLLLNCIRAPIFGLLFTPPQQATKNAGCLPKDTRVRELFEKDCSVIDGGQYIQATGQNNFHTDFHPSVPPRLNALFSEAAKATYAILETKPGEKDEPALRRAIKAAADPNYAVPTILNPVVDEVVKGTVNRAISSLAGDDLRLRSAVRTAIASGANVPFVETLGRGVMGELLAVVAGIVAKDLPGNPDSWAKIVEGCRSADAPCVVLREPETNAAHMINLYVLHSGVCNILRQADQGCNMLNYVMGYINILSSFATTGGYDFGVVWPVDSAAQPDAASYATGLMLAAMRVALPDGHASFGSAAYRTDKGTMVESVTPNVPVKHPNAVTEMLAMMLQTLTVPNDIIVQTKDKDGKPQHDRADEWARVTSLLLHNPNIGLPPCLSWTGIATTGVIQTAVHQVREIFSNHDFSATMLNTRAYAKGVLDINNSVTDGINRLDRAEAYGTLHNIITKVVP